MTANRASLQASRTIRRLRGGQAEGKRASTRESWMSCLLQQRGHLGEHLVHHGFRRPLAETRLARLQVEGPQLMAEHDARGLRARPGERHRKPAHAGKVSARGD